MLYTYKVGQWCRNDPIQVLAEQCNFKSKIKGDFASMSLSARISSAMLSILHSFNTVNQLL